MLATSGRPGGSLDGWVVEPKVDGWRAQAAVDRDGGLIVRTRTGRDITAALPAATALAELGVECVLDGEIAAGAGLPEDFSGLAGAVSSLQPRLPVTFVAFDVLNVDGRSVIGLDCSDRREILECLVRVSDHALVAVNTFPGSDLDEVLGSCEQLRMEGVVVKRRRGAYRPGKRTADWRKVKCPSWRTERAERRLRR
jgi:bifunctional non-homologous end joining protein LigD